ncbi:MAG: type II toxin-antitoxin system PemK/MazF family toxin [Vulcanimicrobiaceae bacterium]
MGPFNPGQILLVDWPSEAPPKEPDKLRPCVVIESPDLFDELYPNVLVVPLTDDRAYVIPALSVEIAPSPQNGCAKTCYAASHAVTTASKQRVEAATASQITLEQVERIRLQVAESIGL